MRFELLLVFDSTDSPDKNHPCAGFILDTNPSNRWAWHRLVGTPRFLTKARDVLDLRAFCIGVAGSPAMVANNKRVQVAIVKDGLDIAGLHARA